MSQKFVIGKGCLKPANSDELIPLCHVQQPSPALPDLGTSEKGGLR